MRSRGTGWRRRGCAALAAAACAVAVEAKTTIIDDSGTLPYNANAPMKWQSLAPRRAPNNAMDGATQVQLRLNVAPWLNRTGRIFMVMPAQQPGPITVSWTTQGRLLPGQMVSGTRALVYAGPITAPYISEVLNLSLTVDGTQMWQAYQLKLYFEMDED